MDTVIQAMQVMVLHMDVDMAWAEVEVSGEDLGPALAGVEATVMEEALDGEGLIPLPADGMDRHTMPLMEVHTP